MPGAHNVLNALAVIAVADELAIDHAIVREALATFAGVQRRFTVLGETAGITVVDDYGHHPAEIEATLEAARRAYDRAAWWSRSSRTATPARTTCSTSSRAPSTAPTCCS